MTCGRPVPDPDPYERLTVPPFRPSVAVTRVEEATLRVQQPASTGRLVSLAMGEPDLPTPPRITAAMAEALTAGYTHYAHLLGDPELRTEIAARVGELAGRPLDPGQVLVTHGGSGGLAAAISAIVDPGDVVVVPDPTYSLYADAVHLAGGTTRPVPGRADLHWDLDRLADALRGATLFVFCNPCNPTGVVHTRAELAALADLLADTDTLVLADEAYADLVYDGAPFVSAQQVEGLADRLVYCQTFSKSYAMTGWRVGYLVGEPAMIKAAARVHNTVNGSMNTAVQRAALTALRTADADVAAMRDDYAGRRRLMLDELAHVDGITFDEPEGAFYVFPRYAADLPSLEVTRMLREHGVAVRPGTEYGAAGEGHVRLSYAASREDITVGVERLAKALASL
jgi:aspartate/methionine/tyrosine aminotransferase